MEKEELALDHLVDGGGFSYGQAFYDGSVRETAVAEHQRPVLPVSNRYRGRAADADSLSDEFWQVGAATEAEIAEQKVIKQGLGYQAMQAALQDIRNKQALADAGDMSYANALKRARQERKNRAS